MQTAALTVGSLFTGIGGFDLGFERAGFEINWMCEIDPFCRGVLRKHWPRVPIYEDIKTLIEPESVDCIIGGFPCQDISYANPNGKGISGSRSGLWREMFRIVCLLRPRYIAIENVAAIRVRGLDRVLCDLASIGYDLEWKTMSARSFGAMHQRRRMFIIAYHWEKRMEGIKSSPIQKQSGLSWSQNVRRVEDFRDRSDIPEPLVRSYSNGLRDRLSAIGNSIVPQVSEYVAMCIHHHATTQKEAVLS